MCVFAMFITGKKQKRLKRKVCSSSSDEDEIKSGRQGKINSKLDKKVKYDHPGKCGSEKDCLW